MRTAVFLCPFTLYLYVLYNISDTYLPLFSLEAMTLWLIWHYIENGDRRPLPM